MIEYIKTGIEELDSLNQIISKNELTSLHYCKIVSRHCKLKTKLETIRVELKRVKDASRKVD